MWVCLSKCESINLDVHACKSVCVSLRAYYVYLSLQYCGCVCLSLCCHEVNIQADVFDHYECAKLSVGLTLETHNQ